jgi:hypothetical protein
VDSSKHRESDSIPLPPEEYLDLVCGTHADVQSAFVSSGQRMHEDLNVHGVFLRVAGYSMSAAGVGAWRDTWSRSHLAPIRVSTATVG